eukprot:TRINITY_DN10970_c0_g1_i1.p1 TRINITY_DN10970_c0_g1~~TRINITY_DN10970_c0_g1_i1.p1  ORF type:complete len:182 (-),score=5.56 TRINITY_DN10970_c0_g1_i1:532-1077(-)
MTSTNQFNCINVKRQFQRKSWFAVGNSCIKKFSCVQKGGVKASNGVRQRFYNKCAPFFVSILANTPVHVSLASVLTEVEPANALSLPTWIIHVSSVAEWVIAMGLVWQFAEVTGQQRWKRLTWGMIPSLGGAMSACTWHFFYNSPDLEWLVTLQSALTVVGNITCCLAAYGIYQGSKQQPQ